MGTKLSHGAEWVAEWVFLLSVVHMLVLESRWLSDRVYHWSYWYMTATEEHKKTEMLQCECVCVWRRREFNLKIPAQFWSTQLLREQQLEGNCTDCTLFGTCAAAALETADRERLNKAKSNDNSKNLWLLKVTLCWNKPKSTRVTIREQAPEGVVVLKHKVLHTPWLQPWQPEQRLHSWWTVIYSVIQRSRLKSKHLQDCSGISLINLHDNTVVYVKDFTLKLELSCIFCQEMCPDCLLWLK